MLSQEKLQKLEEFYQALKESVTKKDIIDAFKGIVDYVKKIEIKTSNDVEQIRKILLSLGEKIKSNASSEVDNLKSQISKELQKIDNKLSMIKDGYTPIKGKDYFDGKDADEEIIVEKVLSQIKLPEYKEVILDDAEKLRDKLETLKDDERLDKSAIRGLDDLEKRIKSQNPKGVSFFGARGIQLYVGGSKKGMVQMVNLIAGTGIALTYNHANGRNDITITATGSASMSVLTATGDINGVNKDFVFASKPTIVIVNGTSYRENNGWSWNAGTSTATLDFAPESDGDVYGL